MPPPAASSPVERAHVTDVALGLVDDEAAWREVLEQLVDEPRYAVDTEFHRERTYYPKLALVQIAWSGGLVLVDPLAVDLAPLAEILDGPGVAVMHAAGQDLEVLHHACGTVPSQLFDTQLAAGFVGMSTPSLASLVDRELGLKLEKGDRLTDWLRRPLTEDQRRYAALDVAHLFELQDRLLAQLDAEGRVPWAHTECERLRTSDPWLRDPDEAWRRIKEVRQLRGRTLAVAQSLAAWRERRAATIDQPVRFVMPDMGLVGVAQRAPRSVDELRKVRGIDDRHTRGVAAEGILAAVAEGLDRPPPPPRDDVPAELARELRPAVGLVSAWVSQLARDLRIDTGILATRADLEALLRGDPDARLAHGWRAEVAGGPIRDLVEGRAAVAFDGDGGLLLERRSHDAL